MNSQKKILSCSEQQIANIIFNIPLDNLLKRIKKENIDGEMFVKNLDKANTEDDNIFAEEPTNELHDRDIYETTNDSIMDLLIIHETGWNPDEAYQVQSIILENITFTKLQVRENMKILFQHKYYALKRSIANRIADLLNSITDIKDLHFKIKNGKNVDEFSDSIMDMIDNLLENKICDDSDVKHIYDAIAECFMLNHHVQGNNKNLFEPRQYQWICNDCGNNNVISVIGSKMNVDLSICTLCGIHQKESIILKLKNYDTFV
eukprot:91704_1